MTQSVCVPKVAIWLTVALLALIVLRPADFSLIKASADTARFDHIHIVSPMFLYQGKQGLLLMDKRNGYVWFIGRESDELKLKYGEPVLITQLPLEKLDQAR